MRRARAALATVVGLVALAAPAALWACPKCATRPGPGLSTFVLVMTMIGIPYVVVAVAFKIVKRLAADPEPDARDH